MVSVLEITHAKHQTYKKGGSMKTKCKKTLSGSHLFMPMYKGWITEYEAIKLEIWKAHGVDNPKKCIACGIIDDLEKKI